MYKKFIEPSELENKSKCIRLYKLICVFLFFVCLVALGVCGIELIIHLGLSVYYIITLIFLLFESILFFMEVRTIHNSDLELQKKVIYFSIFNFFALTIWEFVGGIILESWSIGIGAGITSLIISGFFLLSNIQVKKSLEGKGFGLNRSDFDT